MPEHQTSVLPPAVDLAIVDGPGKGGSIRVPVGSSLVLGRDSSADHRLGGDETISRRHAKLDHARSGHLIVIDLNSTNGVYLAGQRITEPTEIRPGERIELGQSALLLEPSVSEDTTQVFTSVDTRPARAEPPSYEEEIHTGYELLEKKRAAAAEAAFARATALAPQRSEGYLARGVALIQLDRLGEASRAIGDAVRRDAGLTEGWYQLGVITQREGDMERALGYYRHALTLDSAHVGAHKGVQALAQAPAAPQPPLTRVIQPIAKPPAPAGPIRSPQPATLAAALDALAKGELTADDVTAAWGTGKLLNSAHRAMRSFGRAWLGVFALFGLAIVTEPVLRALLDAVNNADSETSTVKTVTTDLYTSRASITAVLLAIAGLMTASIVLRSVFTQYRIYERRVDFFSGVLSRRKSSLWLYDVIDIDSERSPLMLLTNTATLALRSEAGKVQAAERARGRRRQATPSIDRIIGVGTAREMEELWQTLRGIALRERRAMKNQWV